MTVRVADYIADFLYDTLGVKDVFLVTGGGAMFLNDGIAKHSKLNAIINHHEQASAMAAVAYAKYKNSYAVAMTTSGCGATNAVTGLLDAWQDSTPVVFISGQVKKKETVHNSDLPLRQIGVQEADIIPIVQSISKYSVMINDPKEIAYHLEKAAYLAKSGRPGPVWIDIPQDVQGANVSLDDMLHFEPDDSMCSKNSIDDVNILAVLNALEKSARPIVVAGNGIRLAGAQDEFKTFIGKCCIPVTTSYLALDILPSDDPFYVGRLGLKGDRAGNFAIQNSDLVIVLGSRLAVALTGFEYGMFARNAHIIVVDIDALEHQKNTVKIDRFIHGDVKNFLSQMNKKVMSNTVESEWVSKCQSWKRSWPVALPEYENQDDKVNMYSFVDHLSQHLKDDTVVVADAGSAYYVTAQALKISSNQRYITSGAQADMGFTLPAAIGSAVASDDGDVVAITGDGSFQMNIQELQTIIHYQLPIKIFVWNNSGYLSIRTTQSKFFEGRLLGTDKNSGISFPDLQKIANAYGYNYFCVKTLADLDNVLKKTMASKYSVICEVLCPEYQEIVPTVSSFKRDDGTMVSKPTEDMYPFLDRKEFLSQMLVTPIQE